jgi:Rha family phage regulatory protein
MSLPTVVELKLRADGDAIVVNSRDLVEPFDKQHIHILRNIKQLKTNPNLDTSWFRLVMFSDSYGREQPSFDMTRDGFSLLVMGWTGERAMEFKVRYIQAFNAMEAELRRRGGSNSLATLDNLFDRKLEPVHQQMTKLGENVISISDRIDKQDRRFDKMEKSQDHLANRLNDIVPRRKFEKHSIEQFCYITGKFFNGKCLPCQEVKIVDENFQRIPGQSECHHVNGRERKAPSDGMLVCTKCHYKIGHDPAYEKLVKELHVHFEYRRSQTYDNKPKRVGSTRRSSKGIDKHRDQRNFFGWKDWPPKG